MSENVIAFLGCGSWGGALGDLLSKKGYNIQFWHRNSDTCDEMKISRKHYLLTSIYFGKNVTFHSDINLVINGAKYIILAVPSQEMRSVVHLIKDSLNPTSYIINVSKGIENKTLKTMSQVISEIVGSIPNFVTLSGPSHAEEVVKQKPTAIVSASNNIHAAKEIQNLFSTNKVRVYTNQDLIGVEICGSVKNVVAIAAGFCDGFGYGDNTKAALITRGIKELSKLGACFGANTETFFGLAGIGDLIVTCSSVHSRNRKLGESIGKGKSLKQIMTDMSMVAEGVYTAKSVHQLRMKHNVEMPIHEAIYQVLFEEKDPKKSVTELMNRQLSEEDN